MNMNKKHNTSQTTEPAIAVDTVLANVNWNDVLEKANKYLKSKEGKAELQRIANEPIKQWEKPTWEQLHTPMDF